MRALRTVSFACALSAAACGGGGGSEAPSTDGPKAHEAPIATPKAPEGPPPAAVEDTSFRLALQSEPAYTAGQPATVRLVLEARGGYHVNQDYPIRVDLKAGDAVKLQKASLGRPDAAAFGEQSARFDLGFSADKGAHELAATVDFAVCTPETCVPDQRTVAVALHVQ